MTIDSAAEASIDRLDGRLLFVADREADHRSAAIEFRHLRYFVAVAEELHFGRAAARLFITQPALSQAIARLEGALDVKLLVRSRQNVELTDAGAELLRRARRLLADKEEALDRVRSVGRGEAGALRVGVALLAEHEVAPALTALAGAHPGIVFDRSAAASERLLADLAEGRLDAAFVHRVPVLDTLDGVEWEIVKQGRLAVLVAHESELGARSSVTLRDLADQTFLVNPRELAPSAYEGLQLMCHWYGGFEPKLLESSGTSALPLDPDWKLIREGQAIVVLAEGAAHASKSDGIAAVPIVPPPPYVLAMAWRSGVESAVLERFVGFMRTFRDEHGWMATASG